MSWILTRDDDDSFSEVFDTEEEASEYTHGVDSETMISWFIEEGVNNDNELLKTAKLRKNYSVQGEING